MPHQTKKVEFVYGGVFEPDVCPCGNQMTPGLQPLSTTILLHGQYYCCSEHVTDI